MKLNPKQLAVSAALLGLLAAGAALPAAAASPISAPAAITFPWSPVAAESVETGDYAPTMTVARPSSFRRWSSRRKPPAETA